MKVTITAEAKKYITLEEAPIAREIIESMREDEETAAGWAKYAIEAACYGSCEKVYEATATIAKNCRVYDAFGNDSRDLDVWIDATAKTSRGFCIIGFYLTDVWQLSYENQSEIASRMYVRKYFEQ